MTFSKAVSQGSMVHYCNIPNCKNNSDANSNLKFIRLPKDTVRCNAWLQLMGLMNLPNDNLLRLPNAIICSAHLANGQNGKISFTIIKKSEVPAAMLQQSKQLKENNVIGGAGASVLTCGTCNKHFQEADINDATKCETCSRLHHNSCVKTMTKNLDAQKKHWTCEKCDKATNLNSTDPVQVTTEELQKAEIKFLKDENKVLRDQNTYLQNKVYSMQNLMKQMEDNNLNRKEEVQTESTVLNSKIISPTEFIDATLDLCSSDTADSSQNGNFKLEQTEIETTGDYQEDIILVDEVKPRTVTIGYKETRIKIENIQHQQERENTEVESKNISSKLQKDARFFCEFCGKQYKTVFEGLRHLGNHTGNKRYNCEVCGKTYLRKDHVRTHMRSHTGEMPFACKICNAKFAFRSSCYRHEKNHTGLKPFKCNTCSRQFAQKASLQGHLVTHSEQKFLCEICGRKFTMKAAYMQHVRNHSDDKSKKRNTQTNTCVRKTDPSVRKSNYEQAMNKNCVCPVCKKKFKNNIRLKIHLKQHSDKKPYTCQLCKLKFLSPSILKHHMMVHTGEKPHACEICDWKFILKATLKRHMLTHTGEKPFTCSVCNKSFSQKGTLQLHEKIHTGEKNFGCEFCKYKCSSKGQLSKHVVIHSRERRYACDVCGKRFLRLVELRRHLNTHHSINSD